MFISDYGEFIFRADSSWALATNQASLNSIIDKQNLSSQNMLSVSNKFAGVLPKKMVLSPIPHHIIRAVLKKVL